MRISLCPTLFVWLSCISLSHAYVTDLKLVICGTQYACANYPNFRRIEVDLNLGVAGAQQVYLYYREDNPESEPITGLQVGTVPPSEADWVRLDVSLNAGIESKDLWLYYTKSKTTSQSPVDSIIVKKGKHPIAAFGYKRIPIDLNSDVGGDQLYLFYSQAGSQLPITALTAKSCIFQNCYLDGWQRIDKDLNSGTIVGFEVYLFYQQEPGRAPVTDIVLILDEQTPPEGYVKVDTDLNKGTIRGSSIWLWYKVGDENSDNKAIEVVSIEYGSNTVTPFGFTKLDVNLNHGAEGEEIYLSFRRGFTAPPRAPTMVFRKDGTFKILQLADMHVSNGQNQCHDVPTEMTCLGDKTTLDFMIRLLDNEKPDLVVFTGDNINGQSTSDARTAILKYSWPVVERQIPWAMIYGNHDDEGDLTREEMLQTIKEIPYSLTKKGPADINGVGNYVVMIYKSDQEENQTSSNTESGHETSPSTPMSITGQTHAFTLYFLDSHAYPKAGEPGNYDYIKQSQLDWLLTTSRSFVVVKDGKEQPKPNAIAFFHIPIPEYNELELGGQPRAIMGDKRENVSSPSAEIMPGVVFETFRKAGDIKVTACGHDHVNDYCFDLDGLTLCYGGGMGYGTYGASHLGWPRRARVFWLQSWGDTVTTWKRLNDDKLSMLHFETIF